MAESQVTAMSVRKPTVLTLWGAVVVIPTMIGVAALAADQWTVEWHTAVFWILLIAGVELLQVPTWRGTSVSLGFPMLIAVAFLYPPGIAAAIAFLGSSDPRELRREVTPLRALFNRSQVGLSVLAASAVFQSLASVEDESLVAILPAAFLATLVDYAINIALVTSAVALAYRLSPLEVVPKLLGKGQEFLISYVGLGLVGTVLAKLYTLEGVGFFSVVTVLAPLLLARQMFFRSRALEEAHKELQEREQVLRVLSNRMAEERQDERSAIAAYLHDDLAQLLFRLSIQVDVARRHLSTGKLDEVEESLDKIKGTKQETSDRVRALIRDLHRSPLGHAGLAEAIQGFVAEAGRDSGVRFKVDVQEIELPAPIALLIYHVAREATMNALKHAGAHNLEISVREVDDEIELVIADDGEGFDIEAPGPEGHFGMAMMRDRATVGGGTFDVRSAPGAGTTITVRFPSALLQQEQDGSARAVSVPRPGAPQDGASPGTHEPDGGSKADPPASVPA